MKFARCVWRYDNLRGWSPQRIAAAKRAKIKDDARVEAQRQQVALFPELQQEIKPRYSNEQDRMEEMDEREIWDTRTTREEYLAMWRKARAAFYRLPPHRRRGCRLLWNSMHSPRSPYFFAEFVTKFSTPGNSPWTHLRKVRLIWLWNHGGWQRPTYFRDITADFATLGPVTHPRILTQTFISIAKFRGVTSRQVRSELGYRTRHKFQAHL